MNLVPSFSHSIGEWLGSMRQSENPLNVSPLRPRIFPSVESRRNGDRTRTRVARLKKERGHLNDPLVRARDFPS